MSENAIHTISQEATPQCRVKLLYLREAKKLYAEGLGYATTQSAGLDLRACMNEDFLEIAAGERVVIGTGIALEPMTQGVAAFVYSRSGLGTKEGLTVSQGVGVIDPDYRGEIIVSLLNTSQKMRRIERGQRIAQLVFQPFFQVMLEETNELSQTVRGTGGFGHTGKQ